MTGSRSDNTNVSDTANEKLATLVASSLREAGLIAANREDEVRRKVAGGTATEDDWRLWIELEASMEAPSGAD